MNTRVYIYICVSKGTDKLLYRNTKRYTDWSHDLLVEKVADDFFRIGCELAPKG